LQAPRKRIHCEERSNDGTLAGFGGYDRLGGSASNSIAAARVVDTSGVFGDPVIITGLDSDAFVDRVSSCRTDRNAIARPCLKAELAAFIVRSRPARRPATGNSPLDRWSFNPEKSIHLQSMRSLEIVTMKAKSWAGLEKKLHPLA